MLLSFSSLLLRISCCFCFQYATCDVHILQKLQFNLENCSPQQITTALKSCLFNRVWVWIIHLGRSKYILKCAFSKISSCYSVSLLFLPKPCFVKLESTVPKCFTMKYAWTLFFAVLKLKFCLQWAVTYRTPFGWRN